NPAAGALAGVSSRANTKSLAGGSFVLAPLDPHAVCDISAGVEEALFSTPLLEGGPAGTRGLRLVVPARPTLVTIRGRILASDTREPAAGVQALWWMEYPGGGGSGGFPIVVAADGGFEAMKIPDGATIAVEAHATE